MVLAARHRALTWAVLSLTFLVPVRSGVGGGAPAMPSEPHGQLDGMHFVGRFGPAGKPGDRKDSIYFADGHFWSANCVPCGFAPGVYWVRASAEGIHFRGELESPDRGRFVYTGLVRDGRLTVHVNWRRERWYWSIDKDFWFEGEVADEAPAVSVEEAQRLAMTANPQPPLDCDP